MEQRVCTRCDAVEGIVGVVGGVIAWIPCGFFALDITAYLDLRPRLISGAEPLSVQMAVMYLNVAHGYLDASSTLGIAGGLITVGDWIVLADQALAAESDPNKLLIALHQCP